MGSLLKFFLLTYSVSWTCFITALALSGSFGSSIPALSWFRTLLLLLGTFAPSLVALWLTARAEGSAGTHTLLRRLFEWQVGARWYVFAVSYIAAIKLAVALVHRVLTGAWPRFGNEAWYVIVVAIVFSTPVQAGEEIGWRGYALPRLAARFGFARASVVLGLIWACWHLPLFFVGSRQLRTVLPGLHARSDRPIRCDGLALCPHQWKLAADDADALGRESDLRHCPVGRRQRRESFCAKPFAGCMAHWRVLVDPCGVLPRSDAQANASRLRIGISQKLDSYHSREKYLRRVVEGTS